MTTPPIILPPPADFYNRPPKELAGYSSISVVNGNPVTPPTRPGTPGESITLYTTPGPGLRLREQPSALTDYLLIDKIKFDASPYNFARIVINMRAPGAATAIGKLRYSLSGAAGSYVDAGVDIVGNRIPLTISIAGTGVLTGSGFLYPEASDDVYFEVVFEGGNGVASPQLGLVAVQFFVRPPESCIWTAGYSKLEFLASGLRWQDDPDWIYTKTNALAGNWFQSSGCGSPSCIAWINAFVFGSHIPVDQRITKTVTPAMLALLAPGVPVKLKGSMAWTYAGASCGIGPGTAQPDLRITVDINGLTLLTVPSGFPPVDVSPLPFEIIGTANSLGNAEVSYGIYGDSGACSLSLNALLYDVQLEVCV